MDTTFAMLLCSELQAPDCPIFSKMTASTLLKYVGTHSTLFLTFLCLKMGSKELGCDLKGVQSNPQESSHPVSLCSVTADSRTQNIPLQHFFRPKAAV